MGPVDEDRMVFALDCYFRQSWIDERLKFNATVVSELALNWAFLAKIWVPDTYFLNAKKSYLHKITVPNRFVRIFPTGKVSYSQRLTILAECPMSLRKFPLDSQSCPLHVGSFGYDAHEIIYKWAQPQAVSIDKLGLAQFHLMDFRSYETISPETKRLTRVGYRNDSVASLEFNFERQTGFFLLQIYTPLTLIVFCSWVTFWLIKTETGGEVPARTALGANSVLSIVNIGLGGKSRPPVGYATAMDIFIIICFISVFAALVEFACINFIDTFIKRRKKREEEIEAKIKERIEKREAKALQKMALAVMPIVDATATVEVDESAIDKAPPTNVEEEEEAKSKAAAADAAAKEAAEEEEFEDMKEEDEDANAFTRWINRTSKAFMDKVEGLVEDKWGPISDMEIYKNTTEIIWSIDSAARKVFPIVFFILQSCYWTAYLYIF